MEHKQVKTARRVVHYWVSGKGDGFIVFTHGATMDHGMFDSQVSHFSDNWKTITWDVPAHGLSRPYEEFSLEDAADDLVRILDQEGVTSAHLVGQSMGGYIIQFTAIRHPTRVTSLTMIGSSPLDPTYYSSMDRWLLSITPGLLKLYPYNYLVNLIASQISTTESARSYAYETLMTMTKKEISSIMMSVYQGVMAYEKQDPINLPILLTYGDRDTSGKVQAYCKTWAARENRPLKVIATAAHNANMDNPEEFNRILEEFLIAIGD